jgi:peptidyl-tRNA hydrolase, PTH1 family
VATRSIFGLGNPGPRYSATRHNAGFLVVDALARRHALALDRRSEAAVWGEGAIGGHAVRLALPMGFMNRSGESVQALIPDGADPAGEVLIVHDELDLPFGRLKLKLAGGTGGHRGLESIREHLGHADFARLRVGIGRPPIGVEAAAFVLSPFSSDEAERLPELLEGAAAACEAWLNLGIGPAMNRVNARPAAAGDPPTDAGAGSRGPGGANS